MSCATRSREEFINVARGLWDCWSDEAVIADLKTGKFFDESQVKPLNHQGPHFSVKGPLNTGRCPQGQPLVLQAGGSERGQNLAARTADVVFSVVQDFEEAKVAYSSLKERVRRFGRDPDSVTILPGVMPIIGKTDAEARDALLEIAKRLSQAEVDQVLERLEAARRRKRRRPRRGQNRVLSTTSETARVFSIATSVLQKPALQ